MFGAFFITAFTIIARPFESTMMNRLDALNEIFVCLSTYIMYAYTDIIGDQDDLIMFGWVSIGLMGLIVIFNLGFMAFISC